MDSATNSLIQNIIKLLPLSPFKPYIEALKNSPFADKMGYVNWFIPFDDFINIMSAWLIVIGLFYGYSVIMRWVKLIGD